MNNTITWIELARLPIAKMQDVLMARFVGRDEATKLGFSPVILTRLATAISEITRNVVQHAGCAGDFQIGHIAQKNKRGIRVIVSDLGKGIPALEHFLDDGCVSAMGSGLTGTRRLVDQFLIESRPSAGTKVTMDLWLPENRPSSRQMTEG